MEPIKWLFYRLLTSFIGQPKGLTPIFIPQGNVIQGPFYWIFCSTIGELNGCKPLISVIDKLGQLVLITDRDCYQPAFHKQFPEAIIIQLQGWPGEVKPLMAEFPPHQLILCEIPCLPYDAPCRLAYDFLRTLNNKHVPISVVNGWLYDYGPSCRQDDIERRLFSKDYLNTFDKMMVQNQSVRDKLIAAGQDPERISITGNMKFDAIANMQVSFKDDNAKNLIQHIQHQQKVTLVAGSLSDQNEYAMIVEAYGQFRIDVPESFLVLAPRHPEKPEQIDQIKQILKKHKLSFVRRSELTGAFAEHTDVLILDTFGELQGMYYAANLAYVGQNHNILEPLAFGKPVIILDGWESTYPSYPVYEICKEADLVFELTDHRQLVDTFKQLAQLDSVEFSNKTQRKLHSMATALAENLKALEIDTQELR